MAVAEDFQIYLIINVRKKLKNKASLQDTVLRLNLYPLIFTLCFIWLMTQKNVTADWRAQKNKTLFPVKFYVCNTLDFAMIKQLDLRQKRLAE